MIPLDVKFVGEDEIVWDDIEDDRVTDALAGVIKLAVRDKGTASGAPTVLIRIDNQDPDHPGTLNVYVTQTTAKLFVTAAKMIEAKYPGLLR